MQLVPMAALLHHAAIHAYGQGGFNATCWPQVKGILEIHEALQSPAIIQVGNTALGFLGSAQDMAQATLIERKRGAENILGMIKTMEDQVSISVALHADHIKDFETAEMLIETGFTSVMIDGSDLDYEDNISLTRSVAKIAHEANTTVEAELGTLSGTEDDCFSENSSYTNPLLVADFLRRSEADCLAVSYGTQHGPNKGRDTKLRFEIIAACAENLRHAQLKPLIVSHGSSTVPDHLVEDINSLGGRLRNAAGIDVQSLLKAISAGVCKINIDTDIRLNVTRNVRLELTRSTGASEQLYRQVGDLLARNPEEIDFRQYLSPMKEALLNGTTETDLPTKRLMNCIEDGAKEAVGTLISHFGSATQQRRFAKWFEKQM